MKASDLKGRAVVVLAHASKVGEVDDVLFDPPYQRVVGLRVKRGLFDPREAVTRESIAAVGRDAVTVERADAVNDESRLTELASAVGLDQLRGTRVVTEGGELLGTIEDVLLDDEFRVAMSYVLSSSLWDRLRHGEPHLDAKQVLRLGEGGIMIVPDAVVEGLRAKQ